MLIRNTVTLSKTKVPIVFILYFAAMPEEPFLVPKEPFSQFFSKENICMCVKNILHIKRTFYTIEPFLEWEMHMAVCSYSWKHQCL